MANKIKPRLRYFARFTEDFGYLRAYVRNGKFRKYILTPIVVSRDQVAKLDTAGSMAKMETVDDVRIDARLREYTQIVWQTVTPLIESGAFDAMTGEQLTSAIFRAKKEYDRESTRRNLTKLGYDVDTLKEGWEKPGLHRADGTPINPYTKEAKEMLNLFREISEKGEDNGKR